MIERPTIPCKTCGKPTPMLGTKLCDPCWEVETRLPGYLNNEKAIQFVSAALYKVGRKLIQATPPNPQYGHEPDKMKPHPDKAKRQDCANCLYPERSCSECINKAREPKPLAQYLDEYIEHEVELNNICAATALLYAYDSWRELLEQAFDAYESTENVTIKIERV